MKQWESARIASVLERKHPELFAEVVEGFKPQMSDTALIPGLYAFYQASQPRPADPDEAFNQKLFFTCSILDLYDPGSLYFGALTTKRLCTILGQVFGYNNRQSVSKIKIQARLLIKNPRFKAEVKRLSEELKKGCTN